MRIKNSQHKIVCCEQHDYILRCNRVATASISKPIHNVKDGAKCPSSVGVPTKPVIFISGVISQVRELRARQRLALAATEVGGAYRDRTDDLMLAKQPLSQLS